MPVNHFTSTTTKAAGAFAGFCACDATTRLVSSAKTWRAHSVPSSTSNRMGLFGPATTRSATFRSREHAAWYLHPVRLSCTVNEALSFFASGSDPGSSFVDLLRRVAPHDVPGGGSSSPVTGPPLEIIHGTTVLAIRFGQGVVMAGDRRATSGMAIASRRIEKVFPADDFSGIAIAGAAGPAVDLVRLFQVQLEHYEKIEGEPLSLEGKANQLAGLVRANLPAAMQGLRGRTAVRRLRRASQSGPRVQLRRHRRQVRGDRLPDERLRGRARAQLDQSAVARGPQP